MQSEEKMSGPAAHDVTMVLAGLAAGDPRAAAQLLPLVYDELRRLAAARMAHTPPGHTLQATALVHEAYLQLVGQNDPGWNGRAHFFGAAAQAMRNILVDQARRKASLKRGGDQQRIELTDSLPLVDSATDDVVALDEALKQLEQKDPRSAQVVMLRYFAGLTEDDTARALNVTVRTVRRDWKYARAWLHRLLAGSGEAGES